jgi:hypothetical protein
MDTDSNSVHQPHNPHNPQQQLEALPWDELNEEQRQKVERKAEIQAEISRLTKLVRQQDFV